MPNHPHSLKYPLHLFNDRLSLLFCYRPSTAYSAATVGGFHVCNRSRSAASNRSRMTLLFIPVIPSQCICCYPSIVAHSPIMLFLSICCHCPTLSNLLNLYSRIQRLNSILLLWIACTAAAVGYEPNPSAGR